MPGLAAGLYASDFIEHILALGHFSEHGIPPTLHVFTGMVQKIVVLNVDEKLRSGGMRVLACHGDRTVGVLETIVGLIFIGACVAFCSMSAVKPPPCTMKLLMTR